MGLDEPRLREQAREAIRSGRLPARPLDRNLTQHGRSGAACPICGELVSSAISCSAVGDAQAAIRHDWTEAYRRLVED